MSGSIGRRVLAVGALVFGLGLVTASQASALPTLGAQEAPQSTWGGDYCHFLANAPSGDGALNNAGERRVYQLAYSETDEEGRREAVLHVYTNSANWFKQQMGNWEMGQLLGDVVIGCGTK